MTSSKHSDRIQEIDALRGIALFGILLVNIFVFHAPYSYYSQFYGSFENNEFMIVALVNGFASGKFLFLFAFLFGYGITFQIKSQRKKFNTYFLKRMLILLLFGIAHFLLFWFGDILTSYAILGILILPTIRLPDNVILVFGIFFLLFRPIYYIGAVCFGWPMVEMDKPAELSEFISTFQKGSFTEIFDLRIKEIIAFMPENLVWFLPKTFGLFFLGIYASRKKLTIKIKEHVKSFIIVCFTLIGLYIVWEFNKVYFFSNFDLEQTPLYRPLLIAINVIFESFLGIGYIIGLITLFQKSTFITSVMAKTGRMALTNYILQSLLCVLVFYSYGFGLYGKLDPSNLILIAVAIFSVNVVFSNLYLKKKKTGPLEYCWRRLSAGKSVLNKT